MESTIQISISQKLKDLSQLIKFRLTTTVVISSCFGYALAATNLKVTSLLLFTLASYLITGAANIINQIKEREFDALMKRTSHRPLPSGRMSVNEAIIFAAIFAFLGVAIVWFYFNPLAAMLSLLSLILYGFVYTPLKRVGPVAVPVGAIPGAFPPMIGWIAFTGQFGLEPGILFAIQFFWQFPHFWAIAWVSNDDYKIAGYKLLPKGGRDITTAFKIMIYTLFLLPLCMVPYYLGMTGINSAVIALILSILFLAQTFYLMRERSQKAALRLMFGSFIYLPLVQIVYLLDKI